MKQVCSGLYYSIALCDNGTVWAWGDSSDGTLGNIDAGCVYAPVQIPIENVTAICSGMDAVLALKSDGTVWGWGFNRDARLCDGMDIKIFEPVRIAGLSDVKAIAAGADHFLALKGDGTVRAWGAGSRGQLGTGVISPVKADGNPENHIVVHEPARVNITNVVAIGAGAFYSAALKEDGTVWTWGAGYDGQLGNGDFVNAAVPVQAQIEDVRAISCGHSYMLALKNDGTVCGWGNNMWHQLCNLSDSIYPGLPVTIDGLSGVKAIAAGHFTSYAIKSDGTAWAWGNPNYGTLGDGISRDNAPNTPVKVAGLEDVKCIAAGYECALAVRGDGTAWAWGRGDRGQLGVGRSGEGGFMINRVPRQVLIGPQAEPIILTPTPEPETIDLQAYLDAPYIGPATAQATEEAWALDTGDVIQHIAVGDNGSLYAFSDDTVYFIADGRIVWNVTIPAEWSILNNYVRPVPLNPGRSSSVLQVTGRQPVYGMAHGWLYLYAIPSGRSSSTNGPCLIVLSPDGRIARELPLAVSSNYVDDTAILAAGNRVYVFHNYNETVLDEDGNVLFVISGVSDPAAVDGDGFLYVTPAIRRDWFSLQYLNNGNAIPVNGYSDYRTPGSTIQCYGPDGRLVWERDVGTPICRQYISEEIRSRYGTLPVCQDGMLYIPVADGVLAYDTRGNAVWSKHFQGDHYYMFELMPVDSRGNVYVKAQSIAGNTGNASIFVISNNGTETSLPRPYMLEYDPATHTAAQDGILYNAIPLYTENDSTKITLDDLGTYAIGAYDLKNGTLLWSYRLPVSIRHNVLADNSMLSGGIPGTGTESEYSDILEVPAPGVPYSPAGVGSRMQIDIIPSANTVYINFRSIAFEYPVVLNQSRCVFSGSIYAIRNSGDVLYNSPQDSVITSMAANNSTLFAFGGDGKMAAIAIGGIAGIALLTGLALGLKYLLAGTVMRARVRLDKNDNRNLAVSYIREHPGSTLLEVSRGTGMNIGTVRYHAFILGLNHKITRFNDGKFVRYFPNSNFYSREEQLLIAMLRREPVSDIIKALNDTPGLINNEIARETGQNYSATSKLLKELYAKGIVARDDAGGSCRYKISDEYARLLGSLSIKFHDDGLLLNRL